MASQISELGVSLPLQRGGQGADNPKDLQQTDPEASRSSGAGNEGGAKGLQKGTGKLQGPPPFPSGPGKVIRESYQGLCWGMGAWNGQRRKECTVW